MKKSKYNKWGILTLLGILFLFSGCEDDRASQITGSQASVTSGTVTFQIQADRTTVGLNDTFSITLRAVCNGCNFNGSLDDTYIFNYSANSKISPTNDSKTVSLSSGETASAVFVTFTGISPTARGTASIIGTYEGTMSTSVDISIE